MKACARVLAGLFLLWTAVAAAADWRLEPSGSRLAFHASYEGADAPGVFQKFDVHLRFNPEHPDAGMLQVTVMLGSADMGSTDVNSAIHQSEWFDSAVFPQAEFRSKDIRKTEAGRYLAHGTLSVKNRQQDVAVPFTWKQTGQTATMSGELVLNRTHFSIGTGEWASGNVIGLDVKVTFTAVLQRTD